MADIRKQVKMAEDKLRELKNWVAEFSTEETLNEESTDKLNQMIDELALLIGNIGK